MECERFTFKSLQHRSKARVSFTLRQYLKAVVMVSNILLIDAQHRQKHVKQIT